MKAGVSILYTTLLSLLSLPSHNLTRLAFAWLLSFWNLLPFPSYYYSYKELDGTYNVCNVFIRPLLLLLCCSWQVPFSTSFIVLTPCIMRDCKILFFGTYSVRISLAINFQQFLLLCYFSCCYFYQFKLVFKSSGSFYWKSYLGMRWKCQLMCSSELSCSVNFPFVQSFSSMTVNRPKSRFI